MRMEMQGKRTLFWNCIPFFRSWTGTLTVSRTFSNNISKSLAIWIFIPKYSFVSMKWWLNIEVAFKWNLKRMVKVLELENRMKPKHHFVPTFLKMLFPLDAHCARYGILTAEQYSKLKIDLLYWAHHIHGCICWIWILHSSMNFVGALHNWMRCPFWFLSTPPTKINQINKS